MYLLFQKERLSLTVLAVSGLVTSCSFSICWMGIALAVLMVIVVLGYDWIRVNAEYGNSWVLLNSLGIEPIYTLENPLVLIPLIRLACLLMILLLFGTMITIDFHLLVHGVIKTLIGAGYIISMCLIGWIALDTKNSNFEVEDNRRS